MSQGGNDAYKRERAELVAEFVDRMRSRANELRMIYENEDSDEAILGGAEELERMADEWEKESGGTG